MRTRFCAWTITLSNKTVLRTADSGLPGGGWLRGTVGPPGGAWGQFPASYHVQAAGAIGTLVYTFSPTLINEFSWGVNRGNQGVNALDKSAQPPSAALRPTRTPCSL